MMSPERVASNQTIVHHDSWTEEPAVKEEIKQEIEGEKVEEEAIAEDKETEVPVEEKVEEEKDARELQIDRIEAQIQAAARAVVRSIEQDTYHSEDSILSAQTDESYDQEGSQLTYGEGTELTYNGTEGTYETEDEHHEQEGEGDSSSHHDGDIDDDVFSHSDRSGRSSLNSCHDLSDEVHGKELHSPGVEEETAEPMSRIPSAASFTPRESTPNTPSKVLSRPPFRTPSSVRAIQMSSPTPSIFSSPRSTKRRLPTVSRIGTPTSHISSSPTKKTPTRFKAKKEYPLVLLHVTVLPLSWNYSHIMSSPELPPTLQNVKDNWRLLQEKLGDTVLERGILLPHPQDSYEVLEERLLEALELPVRPRAKILKCGHYMGPETPISDSEAEGREYFSGEERKWCDICGRDVKIEGLDGPGEKRFRIKIYASNGLMRAGAWAAAWRDMERVDVEIEPFVEGGLAVELEHMAASAIPISPSRGQHIEHEDDGFVDEEEIPEHMPDEQVVSDAIQDADEELRKADLALRQAQEEEAMRRKIMEEERIREIYGPNTPSPAPRPQKRPPRHVDTDSLPELLMAAFKLAIRDKKNVVIFVLSLLVLVMAVKPRTMVANMPPVVGRAAQVHEIVMPSTESVTVKAVPSIESLVRIVSEIPEVAHQAAVKPSTVEIKVQETVPAEPLLVEMLPEEKTPPALPEVQRSPRLNDPHSTDEAESKAKMEIPNHVNKIQEEEPREIPEILQEENEAESQKLDNAMGDL